MKDWHLRGSLPRTRTARQVDVLAAFVDAGGSVPEAAAHVGIRPSTAKRHLADLRARSGLTAEQLIYSFEHGASLRMGERYSAQESESATLSGLAGLPFEGL